MRLAATLGLLGALAAGSQTLARPAFQGADADPRAERVREMRERAAREIERMPLLVPLPASGIGGLRAAIAEGLAPWAMEQINAIQAGIRAEDARDAERQKRLELLQGIRRAEDSGDVTRALSLTKAYVRSYGKAAARAEAPRERRAQGERYRVTGQYCMEGSCTPLDVIVELHERGYRFGPMEVPLNGGFRPPSPRVTGTHPGYSGESVVGQARTAGNSVEITITQTFNFRAPDWTSRNRNVHAYRFVASGDTCSYSFSVTTASNYSRPVLGKTSESHVGTAQVTSCTRA